MSDAMHNLHTCCGHAEAHRDDIERVEEALVAALGESKTEAAMTNAGGIEVLQRERDEAVGLLREAQDTNDAATMGGAGAWTQRSDLGNRIRAFLKRLGES